MALRFVRVHQALACAGLLVIPGSLRTIERSGAMFPALDVEIRTDVLAPRAAASRHFLGAPRAWWNAGLRSFGGVRGVFRPRNSDAGRTGTPVHAAIAEIRRLIDTNQRDRAFKMAFELRAGLMEAQESGEVKPLLIRWLQRFPSAVATDLGIRDLDDLRTSVEELVTSLASDDDPSFDEALQTRWAESVVAAFQDSGYDDISDWLLDAIAAVDVQTIFEVDVSEMLQRLVRGQAHVSVTVTGVPNVSRIELTLEREYPDLRKVRWRLVSDGQTFSTGMETIVPGLRLAAVGEEEPPPPSDTSAPHASDGARPLLSAS